jgi:parvulin-like peptidyl-prolyl isomerase
MALFLFAGGLLFWVYSSAAVDERQSIVVSDEFVAQLVAERELVLERKLVAAEVDLIRQDFIDQEVLVREAMARQLYLNDGRVRHRLADKMFFLLAEDIGEPTDAELDVFYEAHRAEYRTPELITFSHRYFGGDETRARSSLGQDGVDDGLAFYMGSSIERYARAELLPIFGREFTESLATLPVGKWQGPLRSGRGWHVVRVEARIPSRDVTREEIGGRLLVDWREARLSESRRAQLDDLRNNYRIVDVAESGDD